MRVAIITDTHYGARKGSKHVHDYFELFYKNVFFPSLEEEGIDSLSRESCYCKRKGSTKA